MAIPRGTCFEIAHDDVFPDGAAVVGPVSPDMEYMSNEDKARGKQPEQRIDERTGLPQWKVTVTDPSAEKERDRSVVVTVLDRVQPVPPPAAMEGFDFRPVRFDGLTAEPRVMGEKFRYQGWVFRATAMQEPKSGGGTSKLQQSKSATAQNATEEKSAA